MAHGITKVTYIILFHTLERVHATFFPFRHRFIKKWVYGVALAGIWLRALLGEAGFMCLIEYTHIHFRNIWLLSSVYHVIVLLIIFVSSISIFIKVRFKPTPQHHGASNRERKLNCTLIWVTFSSMLFWLPFCFLAIFGYFSRSNHFFSLPSQGNISFRRCSCQRALTP